MWVKTETKINNKIRVSIIRHGKTPLNESHCYVGVTDENLSCNGEQEIQEKANKKIYPQSDFIFVSPMKRAVQTADIIFPDEKKIKIPEFKEMDFGSFEAKNYEQLKDNSYYRKWIDESRNLDKGEIDKLYGTLLEPEKVGIILPEKMKDFSDRVKTGLEKVIKIFHENRTSEEDSIIDKKNIDDKNINRDSINKECTEKSDVCIVAHGGTIMALMSMYCDEEYYNYMLSCGDGITVDITYEIDKNENINVSCFSIVGRIHT